MVYFKRAEFWHRTGDLTEQCRPTLGECFNPLPPPKRGETKSTNALRVYPSGFNPLPPPKRGETIRLVYNGTHFRSFQSTPPAEARGDLYDECKVLLDDWFQSTPPAEARGD